ncbi:MAG: RDD family protein [Gammaproteobacteria bacterium]|nr:MAG: RDD family protein [Gammaproteobacteria bacterium]
MSRRRSAAKNSRPAGAPSAATLLFRRLAAGFYDLLLLAGLLMLVGFAVIVARQGEAVRPGTLWFQALLLAVTILFYAGFWSRGGQTLGMRSWRLQVVDERGLPPRFRVCLLRFVAALLSLAPFGLGLWWMLWDPQRRSWHDRLTHTRVVLLPKTRT